MGGISERNTRDECRGTLIVSCMSHSLRAALQEEANISMRLRTRHPSWKADTYFFTARQEQIRLNSALLA
jgi:hypothetical protein